MRRLGLLVVTATALVLGACGDNIVPETPIDSPRADARPDGTGPDGMPDAPDGMVPTATFESFVIDQIKNHTVGTTDPVAFADFSTLADPNLNDDNYNAFATLFQ